MARPIGDKISAKLAELNSDVLFNRLWEVVLTKVLDQVAGSIAPRIATELTAKIVGEKKDQEQN